MRDWAVVFWLDDDANGEAVFVQVSTPETDPDEVVIKASATLTGEDAARIRQFAVASARPFREHFAPKVV